VLKKKHISPFFLPISSLRDTKIGCLLYIIIQLSTSLQVKLHPETIFFEADCLRSSASIHIPLLIIASKGSNRMRLLHFFPGDPWTGRETTNSNPRTSSCEGSSYSDWFKSSPHSSCVLKYKHEDTKEINQELV